MRSELFHPLMAHFPIVLFSLYPVAAGAILFLKDSYKEKTLFLSRCLVYAGLLTHFLSMYLGDMALERITDKVCKLQLVYEHEQQAKLILLFIVIVILIDVLEISKKLNQIKLLHMGKFLFSLISLWFVIQTGHTGATLVYDYGTAVEIPMSCRAN